MIYTSKKIIIFLFTIMQLAAWTQDIAYPSLR